VVKLINGEDSTAVLDGFTIENGSGESWFNEHGFADGVGGGILMDQTNAQLKNLIIRNNNGYEQGGGIFGCLGHHH